MKNSGRCSYGFEAIERVNSKGEVWGEFVEDARVLKLKYHPDAHSHLRQLEKEPDSQLINDLMELYLKLEKPEFETIFIYLLHRREANVPRNPGNMFKNCVESVYNLIFSK